MLVGRIERRVHAEVDTDAIAHKLFTIQRLSYSYRRLDVEEGNHDAAEGLERRPCMYFCMLIDGFTDLSKSVELEDLGSEKVCDYECV